MAAMGFRPASNGKNIVQDLFPNARVTDWRRDANSSLGRKNPRSYHVKTGAAVDMAAVPGMTFEQAKRKIQQAGYSLIEAIDEYANPSPHATGGHWHFVIGER